MIVRPKRLTTTYAGAAVSLTLGTALLASTLPVRAEDDVPFDQKIMRGIMEGLGLKRDGEAINYQERAPLVIPPNRTLPPPETADRTIANNPAWPKDPDVTRRKLEAEQERKPRTTQDMEADSRPLRPDQLTPGRNSRGASSRIESQQSYPGANGDRLSPLQLGYKGGLFGSLFGSKDSDVASFTGEPPRTALTAPPVGYQTPSPDQPYGLGKDKSKPKAFNYEIDRATQNN